MFNLQSFYYVHILVHCFHLGESGVSCTISDVSFLLINYCRHAFATLSFVAEIFIFLYVGMDALDIDKWRFISDR